MNPIEVHFAGIAPSAFLATAARRHASQLCRVFPEVVAVDVTIALDPGDDRGWDTTNAHYGDCPGVHVHLELHRARGDVVVDREPATEVRAHDDAYRALREAFDAGQGHLRARTSTSARRI